MAWEFGGKSISTAISQCAWPMRAIGDDGGEVLHGAAEIDINLVVCPKVQEQKC
jgi:hypothetical protein